MFCKWCGLESETSDVCSWCRKPFSTAAAAHDQIAAQEPAPGDANSPAEASPFDDFDDLSPLPFGGAPSPIISPPARPTPPPVQPSQVSAPPPAQAEAQPVAPPAVPRPSIAPPPYVPPVSPGRTGPGYTPAQPRQPLDDRPPLEPIPIRKPGAPGRPLPVIPIQKPAQPASPPPSVEPPAQPPRTVIPLAGPPVPPPSIQPPPAAPLNAAPPAPVRPPAAPLADTPPAPLIEPAGPEELDLPPLFEEPSEEAPFLAPAPGRRLDLGSEPEAPPAQTRPEAPPPPPPMARTATMTPPAPRPGARTYYCRWCGLDSETPDICSWCRKDMRNLPQATSHHVVTTRHVAPPKRGPVRQAPVKPVAPPAPAPPSPGSNGGHPAPAVPELGTFTAQKSKYYTDKVMDPISGAHYDADTGEAEIEDVAPIETEEVNLRVQVPINIGILAAIALVAGVAVHVMGVGVYLAVLAIANFAAGIAMPLLRTVPFGEDDSDDVALFLGLTLILGPFVGAILFGVIGFAKGNANPAIVGIYISYLVIRIVMIAAAGQDFRTVLPFFDTHWQVLVAQAMPLVTLAGWYAAGMFHKPDE